MSTDPISQAVNIVGRYQSWEKSMVHSESVQLFYTKQASEYKLAAFGASIGIGIAKVVTDPVVDLVGIVAFPIMAHINKDKNYLFAAGFAFFEAAVMASYILMCIYVFSTTTTVVLTGFIVVKSIASHFVQLKNDPSAYKEKEDPKLCGQCIKGVSYCKTLGSGDSKLLKSIRSNEEEV